MSYEVDGTQCRMRLTHDTIMEACFLNYEAYIDIFGRLGLQRNGAPIKQHVKNSAYKDQIPASQKQLAKLL